MSTSASGISQGSREVLHALEEGLLSPSDILFPSDLFSGPGSQPLQTCHRFSVLSPILRPFSFSFWAEQSDRTTSNYSSRTVLPKKEFHRRP